MITTYFAFKSIVMYFGVWCEVRSYIPFLCIINYFSHCLLNKLSYSFQFPHPFNLVHS